MVIYWLGVLAKKNVASTEENMIINSYETNLKLGEVNMIGIITKHVRKEIKRRTWQTTKLIERFLALFDEGQ